MDRFLLTIIFTLFSIIILKESLYITFFGVTNLIMVIITSFILGWKCKEKNDDDNDKW